MTIEINTIDVAEDIPAVVDRTDATAKARRLFALYEDLMNHAHANPDIARIAEGSAAGVGSLAERLKAALERGAPSVEYTPLLARYEEVHAAAVDTLKLTDARHFDVIATAPATGDASNE